MKFGLKGIVCAGLVATLIGGVAAFAETPWEAAHPRRDQVNDRLENENKRINQGVSNGTLSPGEAHQLHREDRVIRRRERRFARHHGGHISVGEERRLNRQENAVSNQIYNEKH